MNKGLATLGLSILTLDYLLFWYLLLVGLLSIDLQPVMLVWGLAGSIGLVLTLMGVSTGRSRSAKMPARICIHCGRSIKFNESRCPYCKEALKPIATLDETNERKTSVPLARRLGRLLGKSK